MYLQLYIAVGPALCCINCPYPETFVVLDVRTPLLIAFFSLTWATSIHGFTNHGCHITQLTICMMAPSISGSSAWNFISSFRCLLRVLDGF